MREDSYTFFAEYYDTLTANVDYTKRAAYFSALLNEYAPTAKLLVDLACGTGSLTLELAKFGYDLIATDASSDMLLKAVEKNGLLDTPYDILFLQQQMQELELHGKVDGVICALDSINHLASVEDVERTFLQVGKYCKKDGVFIFDVNTLYKHQHVLSQNAFIYETEEVFCAWQNEYQPKDHRVDIYLDFFVEDSEDLTEFQEDWASPSYYRQQEEFSEWYYSPEILHSLLNKAGFRVTGVFHADTTEPPKDTSQRIVYVAHKQ